MGQIDPLQVIREAFVLVSRMHLRLPTRFALLDKALATLGSVGTELYPDFNVFEVAEPYAAELVARRYSPRRLLDRSREELESYGGLLMELPYQVHDTLEQLRDGEVEVQFRHKGLDELTRQADVVFNRLVIAVVMAALLVGSSLIGSSAHGGRPRCDLDQDLGEVADVDRLDEQGRYERRIAVPRPRRHHGREVVEVRRPDDRRRDRPGSRQPLLMLLPDVVRVVADTVDADDR